MKKIIFSTVFAMFSMFGFAQADAVYEPEYVGQICVVNPDGSHTLLPKEKVDMKSSSSKFGMIPIPGSSLLDKSKTCAVVKGVSSQVVFPAGKLTLIFRAGENKKDPKEFIGFVKFEVKKNKRQAQVAKSSLLGGISVNSDFNDVPYTAKKYGEESYIIEIDNIEAGQYAFSYGNFLDLKTFGIE